MKEYLVAWEIMIEADSAVEAAEKALRIQRDPISHATVFKVFEEDGSFTDVDLLDTEIEDVEQEDAQGRVAAS